MAANSKDEEEVAEEEAPPIAPARVLPSIPRAWLLSIGVCVLLSLQNSSYTLVRRFGHGVLREEASSQSILAVGEMMKLAFCLYMVLRQLAAKTAKGEDSLENGGPPDAAKQGGADADGGPNSLVAVTRRLAVTSAPMAVPALIFLAMNLLSFVALRRISASAFTLIQQSKLIATAVLSRLILGKVLSVARWRALGTLLFAVLIISYETHPSQAPAVCKPAAAPGVATADEELVSHSNAAKAAEYALGITAVSLEAILSGFSNVYFERVLKTTSLSLWERNVQLAGYSLLIYVPMALSVHPNLLHGWSALTWLTAFLGALGGILIGLVINYMDSISKNLALSVAIVLTACLDHALFDGPMNLPIVSSAGIVILSILTYSSG